MINERPLSFLRCWNQDKGETTDVQVAGANSPQLEFADYVISFKFNKGISQTTSRMERETQATQALTDLTKRLVRAGLQVEIREALRAKRAHLRHHIHPENKDTAKFSVEQGHILLFVRCNRDRLLHEWSRSRLHDWLGGMLPLRRVPREPSGGGLRQQTADPLEVDPETHDDPSKLLETQLDTADHISAAERQRLVYRIIVGPASDGCAEINAEKSQYVDSIFPLQDRAFNKEWIKSWSSKWLINRQDLRQIREHFGEEIAMYFAFLQSYFLWLALPAAVGVLWWGLGWSFSWQFGVLLVLWGILFTETWTRRESDIATYWGVHGVQRAGSVRRANFTPERYIADPATGEQIPYFSNGKRWVRRMLGVPVVLILAVVMAVFISFIFALQTFLGEYYDGPFRTVLGLTPIILFSACLPFYTAICTLIAKVLTEYENYEYESEYAAQYTTKIFVFQFLQDQLYLFLTAWVFVPHRDGFERWLHGVYDSVKTLPPWMVPFLAHHGTDSPVDSSVRADPNYTGLKSSSTPATLMVQNLLTGFVVTSQIVNLFTETVMPLALRWWKSRALQHAQPSSLSSEATVVGDETASDDSQSMFIAQVTEETELEEYHTYEDYAEMASQFGRVAFFSVAWPLAPLAAFVNNWLELRTDAAKICGATRRPVPRRVDTIGPWLDTLRLMCWLSSITNALLIYQFHPDCAFLPSVADPEEMLRFGRTSLSFALVVLLLSEHIFLAVHWVINRVIASWPSAYSRIVARSQAQSRRRWLDRAPSPLRNLAAAEESNEHEEEEPLAAADLDMDGKSSVEHESVASEPLSTNANYGWRIELEHGIQTIGNAFKST